VIFNNHPKVKELGLKLTVDIAHHVMHSHVNRQTKKITGCHHLQGPCFCYTVTKIKTFNCGVSIAKVNCGNCMKPSTTLFPDHWTHSKIIEVILNSLENNTMDIWESRNQKNITLKTNYGFAIEIQIKNKMVDTYFPQIKSIQG
jgi:hypothetical protein